MIWWPTCVTGDRLHERCQCFTPPYFMALSRHCQRWRVLPCALIWGRAKQLGLTNEMGLKIVLSQDLKRPHILPQPPGASAVVWKEDAHLAHWARRRRDTWSDGVGSANAQSCDTKQSHCSLRCVCLKSLSCLTLCNPIDCNPPSFSVHGIFQAEILEWVAIPSSSGSSQPRDWTRISFHFLHWQVDSLPLAPPGKPHSLQYCWQTKASLDQLNKPSCPAGPWY